MTKARPNRAVVELTEYQDRILREAAELTGLSRNGFMLSRSLDAAREVIQRIGSLADERAVE